MEITAHSSPSEERKVIRIGEVPPARSIEEWTQAGSRALKFVGYALTLVVAFFAWLFVLMGASVVLFFHLIAAAMARGTNATLGAVLTAESTANSDMTSTFTKLKRFGRTPGPSPETTEDASRRAA